MLKFVIGRKHTAIHKDIFNCEALKAAKARRWTVKNIWRDVTLTRFCLELVCTRIPGCYCEKN